MPTESIMVVPQKLRYRIKLLRFKDWSVQNGIFLLGAFFSDNLLAHGWVFVLASLALACLCLAYGYGLNEYFDELKDELVGDPRTAAELYRFIYLLLALAL